MLNDAADTIHLREREGGEGDGGRGMDGERKQRVDRYIEPAIEKER